MPTTLGTPPEEGVRMGLYIVVPLSLALNIALTGWVLACLSLTLANRLPLLLIGVNGLLD